MLFSGGTVSWYIVCSNVFHLSNTIWAMILPYLMNAWFVIIMRTFFKTNVPYSIIESGQLDGANEYIIFFKLVLPISLPGDCYYCPVSGADLLERLVASDYVYSQARAVQPTVPPSEDDAEYPADKRKRKVYVKRIGSAYEYPERRCKDGSLYYRYGSDTLCVSVLPEVFYTGSHGRKRKGISLTELRNHNYIIK